MKKIFLFLMITNLSACAAVDSVQVFDKKQAANMLKNKYVKIPAKQMIKLALPREQAWKTVKRNSSIILLRHPEETTSCWTETIQGQASAYARERSMTAAKFIETAFEDASSHCQKTCGQIITKNPLYITYKLTLSNCNKEKNQTQIGKAFNGIDAVYLVRYAAISGKVSEMQVNKMTRSIMTAKLVTINNKKNSKQHSL